MVAGAMEEVGNTFFRPPYLEKGQGGNETRFLPQIPDMPGGLRPVFPRAAVEVDEGPVILGASIVAANSLQLTGVRECLIVMPLPVEREDQITEPAAVPAQLLDDRRFTWDIMQL